MRRASPDRGTCSRSCAIAHAPALKAFLLRFSAAVYLAARPDGGDSLRACLRKATPTHRVACLQKHRASRRLTPATGEMRRPCAPSHGRLSHFKVPTSMGTRSKIYTTIAVVEHAPMEVGTE
jgi:hypothetical protein